MSLNGMGDKGGVGKGRERRTGVRRSQRRSQEHRGWHSRGYLPHFDSPFVIQHITYRLADSLPRATLVKMQAELEASIPEEEQRKSKLRQQIETYLDAGHGSCILRVPEIASCVVDTWQHFDGVRYRLLEWVVMPNHCHVLIEPMEGTPLERIVLSWKNYTARFINEYLRRNEGRRAGDWEDEGRRTGVRRSQGHSQELLYGFNWD